jgi:hypothetical protein
VFERSRAMKRRIAEPTRVAFAVLVLGSAVATVARRLQQGERTRLGLCSAIAAGAVLTRRRGDRLTPVITWSVAYLLANLAFGLARAVMAGGRARLEISRIYRTSL